MKILSRYISKTILSSTLMVLFVLLGLYTFMDFIAELNDLGKGNYQLMDIATYIFLTMPKRLYELLPVAALLGTVLGLGSLASQSELVAMRAAGISIQQINRAVMMAALLLMFIAVILGEVIRPFSEQKAEELQSVAQTGTTGSHSDHGFWTRDGLHFNHIEHILPDSRFLGISIYEFDQQHHLLSVIKAEQAEYIDEHWLLTDVVKSDIDQQGVRVKSEKHAEWQSKLNPGLLNIVIVPPAFLPVWELVDYIDYLKSNNQAVDHYEIALWTKIMMPFASAVMVFLAVPFVFGPLRSAPIGGRIVTGALVGIGFHLFNKSFQHMGLVFRLEPWLSATIPILLFASLAWFMMRRTR